MRRYTKCCALLIAVAGLGGCAQSGSKVTPKGTPEGATGFNLSGVSTPQYTSAAIGLPKGKIWKSQIAVGDINGDGFADLGTVSRLADGPWIWKGDGKGNWVSASDGLPREPFCGGGMDFGDINKDGKTDVVIADHCKGVFAFTGDGAGHWTSASAGLPTIGCEDIALGDFNEDGCADVAVVAASEEGVRVFLGNCKGVWREDSTGLPKTEWGNSVVVTDFNKDGHQDIAAAYSAGPRVWLGNGKGEWKESSDGLPAPEVHGLYWGITAGDLNGDGLPDLAATDQSRGPEVYLQTKDGHWVTTSNSQCSGGSNPGAFCDSDGDCSGGACAKSICKGVCDLGAVGRACLSDADCSDGGKSDTPPKCNAASTAGKLCSSGGAADQCGNGICAAVTNGHGLPPMNALGIVIGDLNNDGKGDLVVAGKTNTEEIGGVYGVYAFLGDGKGNFSLLKAAGLPDGGWERTWGVGLPDIDHDGVLDIAVAFGDVLPPAWRSGVAHKDGVAAEKPGFFARLFGSDDAATKTDKTKKDAPAADKDKPKGPERGFFGSIEVWRGQLPK